MSARRWTRQPAAWCLLLRLASILVDAHPSPDLSNLHGHVSLGSGAKPLEPLSQMKHATRLEEYHRSPSALPEDDASPAAPLAAFARRYLADSGLGTSKLTAVPGLSPCEAKAHAGSSSMIMYGLPIRALAHQKAKKLPLSFHNPCVNIGRLLLVSLHAILAVGSSPQASNC